MAQETLGFDLSRAFRAWRYCLDKRLKPEGITHATWMTLAYLERGGEGMQQRELAEFMGIEAPSLVRLLDQLERDDIVQRREALGDRRAKTVHIKADAAAVLATFNRIAAATRADLLHGIDTQDLAVCQHVLQRVIENAAAVGCTDLASSPTSEQPERAERGTSSHGGS